MQECLGLWTKAAIPIFCHRPPPALFAQRQQKRAPAKRCSPLAEEYLFGFYFAALQKYTTDIFRAVIFSYINIGSYCKARFGN
jgi:hypothetical protein